MEPKCFDLVKTVGQRLPGVEGLGGQEPEERGGSACAMVQLHGRRALRAAQQQDSTLTHDVSTQTKVRILEDLTWGSSCAIG